MCENWADVRNSQLNAAGRWCFSRCAYRDKKILKTNGTCFNLGFRDFWNACLHAWLCWLLHRSLLLKAVVYGLLMLQPFHPWQVFWSAQPTTITEEQTQEAQNHPSFKKQKVLRLLFFSCSKMHLGVRLSCVFWPQLSLQGGSKVVISWQRWS